MTQDISVLKAQMGARINHKKKLYDESILNRWAAVNLILHHSDCWRLAMIKRVENPSDPWSGHYAFPGGRVEEGEGHEAAALRETQEEVGIEFSKADCLGQFYSFQLKVHDKPVNLGISSILTVTSGELPILTPQPSEVAEAYWFKVSDFINPHFIQKQSFKGYAGNIFRPCIKIDQHIIWGISYSIFQELVAQLDGFKLSENLILDSSVLPF